MVKEYILSKGNNVNENINNIIKGKIIYLSYK